MLKVRLLYCVCVTCSCENRINSITEENHTRYRYTAQRSNKRSDRGEVRGMWGGLALALYVEASCVEEE